MVLSYRALGKAEGPVQRQFGVDGVQDGLGRSDGEPADLGERADDSEAPHMGFRVDRLIGMSLGPRREEALAQVQLDRGLGDATGGTQLRDPHNR